MIRFLIRKLSKEDSSIADQLEKLRENDKLLDRRLQLLEREARLLRVRSH